MADESRIPCRCLLSDSWPDLHTSVAEYIATLPEDQRTPDPQYRERLALCLSCDHLRDGTCTLCGCYVEARAAKRHQKCPSVPGKWGRM